MKAQLRTLETVSAIFIFFILLGLGMVFYGNASAAGIEKEMQNSMELRALNVAEQAQSMPELQCSTNNIAAEKCFEQIKLGELDKAKPNLRYFDAFGYGEIKVSEIYPSQSEWTIYSNIKTGFKSRIAIQIPVTIADTVTQQNKFGILTVAVYE